MALTHPKDTLSHHLARVFTAKRDMSKVPCSAVASAVTKYVAADKHSSTMPEAEALWFYGMNHGMALLMAEYSPLEPMLPDDLMYVESYYDHMSAKSVRAFYYLLLICLREARHNKSLTKDKAAMTKQFGASCAEFFYMNGGEQAIHQKFLSTPPPCSIGTFVQCIRWQFYNSSWNGGYGGPAWGKVTDCLVRFVTGEFTAEMMMDTIWTLAHNNGPIFNKGHLYGHYTANLVRILDIQRSGQVIEAVLHGDEVAQYAPPELKQVLSWVDGRFPGKIGQFVDWYVVEALGSVHKYPADKQKQIAKHGMSDKATAAEKAAAAAAQAKKIAEQKAKEEYEAKHFEVMPGVVLEKFEPVRLAA